MSRASRRTLVSHKLRDFSTGDPSLDKQLNENLRDHVSQVFEKIRYFDKYTPDQEITSLEVTAGANPTDFSFPYGDSRRLGILSDSSTNNSAALQDLVDSLSGSGHTVEIRPYGGTGTINVATTVVLPSNIEVICYPGVSFQKTGSAGPLFQGNDVANIRWTGGEFVGYDDSTDLGGSEAALFFIDNRGVGGAANGYITLREMTVHESGSSGISCLNASVVVINECNVYHCLYAGVHVGMSQLFSVVDCRIHDTSQAGGVATYGIALHGDYAGGNPTNYGFIEGNYIYNIQPWDAIGGHDVQNLMVSDNQIFNVRTGVDIGHLTSGNVVQNISVVDNDILLTTTDTWSGSGANSCGIICAGYDSTNRIYGHLKVANNVVRGHGHISGGALAGTPAPIFIGNADNVTASDNAIWDVGNTNGGVAGFVLNGRILNLNASGNSCQGSMANGAIRFDACTLDLGIVSEALANQTTSTDYAIIITGSTITQLELRDFTYNCLAVFLSTSTITTLKTDFLDEKAVTLSAGSQTVDILGCNAVVLTGNGGGSTVTNFVGGYSGMTLTVRFVDANTTVNRANAVLSGGANFISTASDILMLVLRGSTWYETNRSVNS